MREASFVLVAALAACTGERGPAHGSEAGGGGPADAADAGSGGTTTRDGGPLHGFCSLPGSMRVTASGVDVVPGGPGVDLSWLSIPKGICVHYFGNVGNARQLRFAPGGELFVASPTTRTTGGGSGGLSAVVILPDDDHDGVADSPVTFLSDLPSTQGLLFTDQYFYYQDHTKILRLPYEPGDRKPRGASEQVADITVYVSDIHWPKTLDQADDGTIYVGNGGDQQEVCEPDHPFHGGILELDGSPGGAQVAKGLRNPIAIRCLRGKNRCYAVELSKDYSGEEGGREKMIPIRQGDDWGFPCCATKDLPYPDITPVPDCSNVVAETESFVIGDTPFSFDFEPGKWPAPWAHRAFVPLHGAVGSWQGARVVAISMDPETGLPVPGSTLGGSLSGGMAEFATGWDDGSHSHGRPAAITFAEDGRLFLANDVSGDIVWMAPLDL